MKSLETLGVVSVAFLEYPGECLADSICVALDCRPQCIQGHNTALLVSHLVVPLRSFKLEIDYVFAFWVRAGKNTHPFLLCFVFNNPCYSVGVVCLHISLKPWTLSFGWGRVAFGSPSYLQCPAHCACANKGGIHSLFVKSMDIGKLRLLQQSRETVGAAFSLGKHCLLDLYGSFRKYAVGYLLWSKKKISIKCLIKSRS